MDNDNPLWFWFLLPYGIFRNILCKGKIPIEAQNIRELKRRARRESGMRKYFNF